MHSQLRYNPYSEANPAITHIRHSSGTHGVVSAGL
jgi:hypothetical protein